MSGRGPGRISARLPWPRHAAGPPSADGRDLLSEKRKPLTPTFREATLTVHETNRPRWRSAKQTKN